MWDMLHAIWNVLDRFCKNSFVYGIVIPVCSHFPFVCDQVLNQVTDFDQTCSERPDITVHNSSKLPVVSNTNINDHAKLWGGSCTNSLEQNSSRDVKIQ
jgi:hypothetical protein